MFITQDTTICETHDLLPTDIYFMEPAIPLLVTAPSNQLLPTTTMNRHGLKPWPQTNVNTDYQWI